MSSVAGGVYKGPRFPDWPTPQWLFDLLNEEFGFTLDVCALPENAKCAKYFTPEDDGLSQDWNGICYMNPPYGRGIGEWLGKARKENERGSTVVCLVPVRTSTRWWRESVYKADEVRFLNSRIKFKNTNSAPFDSCVVVFRGKDRANQTVCQ